MLLDEVTHDFAIRLLARENPQEDPPLTKSDFQGPLSIRKFEPGERKTIETLVDRILAAKQRDPCTDTGELEQEIDRHVYALYGLTPEGI